MRTPNTPILPIELPIARYRFHIQAQQAIGFPEFAGSTLRGAFGHALKQAACMTREKNCPDCALYHSCLYPAIFAPPTLTQSSLHNIRNTPPPYLIEPPSWGRKHYSTGEQFSFNMVLMGSARHQLALISYAWQKAFAKEVGKGQGKLIDIEIEKADKQWQSVMHNGRIQEHPAHIRLPENIASTQTLHIHTPLRLQHNGNILNPKTIDSQTLLIQLLRRSSLVSESHLGIPIQADFTDLKNKAGQVSSTLNLHWKDWTRYSNRQQQKMQLGGCIGTWHLEKIPLEFRQLLYLGQWLHIGKNTVFGMGGYTLQTDENT